MYQDKLINDLKLAIKEIELEPLINLIAFEMSTQVVDNKGDFESILEKTNLMSPYRQYLYLINLLLSRETDGSSEYSIKQFNKIKKLLDQVTLSYTSKFFPSSQQELSMWSDEKKHINEVVMAVFMDYFNTSDLRYHEQVCDRIKKLYSKYDNEINKEFSNNTSELIEIVEYIEITLQKQFDLVTESTEILNKKMEKAYELESKGVPVIEMQTFLVDDLSNFDVMTKNMFKIFIDKLIEKFGENKVKGFLDKFSMFIEQKDFNYFTDQNDFVNRPIIYRDGSDYFIVPIFRQLINAIEEQLYQFCNLKFGSKFTRHRDMQAEERTLAIFDTLFDSKCNIYTSVFETDDSHNEHDILIAHEDNYLICEVKARRVREPFRDPEKAYKRILQDFKSESGIQHAYNQALGLKKHILKEEQCKLYDKSGKLILEIEKKNINNIYCICITDSNFSILATRLDLLLEKEVDEPYPFATSIDNLESLVTTFKFLGKDFHDFYNYLTQRSYYHEKFHATDELEIAGAFLYNDGLDKIEGIESADKLFLTADNADIFDQVYYKSLGYDVDITLEKTKTYKAFKSVENRQGKKAKSKSKKNIKKMAKVSKKKNRKK